MMTIKQIVAALLIALLLVGCKKVRGQILDGPGMERDSTDYPQEEPLEGMNKEAIFDGSGSTSTHAFKGSNDGIEMDLLDISENGFDILSKKSIDESAAYYDMEYSRWKDGTRSEPIGQTKK